MFLSDRTMKLLIESGLPSDQLVQILQSIRADEDAAAPVAEPQVDRRKRMDRERKRRVRNSPQMSAENADNCGQAGQLADKADPSLSPLPPTPPNSTNLSSNPPYSPPKSEDLAERIWALQPAKHRRSTRPDVRAAVGSALKRGADPESLFAALRAYYRLPDCLADDGKFAKAAHRIVANDRWRDFLPQPEPPSKPADAAVIAHRLQHYRDTGEWKPAWGAPPQERAA